jgi:2-polyprenyl-3-methyl-5-hydroxy-6-metoxy-1,4-benzoquinol methylase
MNSNDVKNKAMACVWMPQETNVDQATVSRWIYGISNTILWSRYLYWAKFLDLRKNLKTIELGCGYGKLSMAFGLSGAQTTLLDYNQPALEAATQAHRLAGLHPQTLMQDLLNVEPKYKNSFDVVCSTGTLEHFFGEHRRLAFQAHADLLKPGGLLFFTVPNRKAIFYRIAFSIRKKLGFYPKEFYEEPFSIGELKKFALQSGISVLEVEGVGMLKDDFNEWIVTNIRSMFRKVFRVKNNVKPDLRSVPLGELDLTRRVRDNRAYLDKTFSYLLLFAGVKQTEPRR